MHCSFSNTVLAAFGLISIASAGPIAARQVCGAAPTGTVAQTPLAQPTGITTAAECAAQCKGNPACLAFLFGLVDGVDKCILYSVPAASIPPQVNLVVYDIACPSIPSVVPTPSNPGGLARRGGAKPAGTPVGTHANPVNAVPAGSPSPIAEPVVDDLSACLAACNKNPACIAYTFESGVCKLFGPTRVRRQAAGTHANPINSAPAGSPTPIAEPAVNSLAACLAACKGNPSCIAYTFESGVCKLFGPTSTPSAKVAQSPSTVSSSTGTHANPTNAIPAGSPTPIATPVVTDLTACLAACKANSACIAYVFESGVCKLFD
ncbi:hypothetical protein ACEPPN_016121 [Leptodophora sp. 'Broadleaf-Isolate-01']